MERVRIFIQYCKDLRDSKIDTEHPLMTTNLKFMKKYHLWYTQKEWEKATNWNKFLNMIQPIWNCAVFTNTLCYQFIHRQEIPMAELAIKLAHVMLVYVGLFINIGSRVYRSDYGKVMEYATAKNWAILERPDKLKYRTLRNRTFLGLIILCTSCTLVGCATALLFFFETVRTGELFFKMVLPFEVDRFHTYLICLVQVSMFLWFYAFCAAFMLPVLEPFFIFAVLYKIMSDDLRSLRSSNGFSEEEEYQKLCTFVEETLELKRYVQLASTVNRVFLISFINSMCIVLGIFIAVIFITDSILLIAVSLIYPVNLYILGLVLCSVGQYLTNCANNMENAIYECDWYTAPRRFKKAVLLFMIHCRDPITIEAHPFYELNYMLFCKITKNLYMFITLVMQFLK